MNKGEAVCVQRCLSKYFETLEVVSKELAEIGMASQGIAGGVPAAPAGGFH